MGILSNIHNAFFSSPNHEADNYDLSVKSYADDGMDAFRSDNWSKLSSEQRLESLRDFSNDYAEKIGLNETPNIVSVDGSYYGYYDRTGNTIGINLSANDNPYEALDTVMHECNHGMQQQTIDAGNSTAAGYTDGDYAVIKAQNCSDIYISNGIENETQTYELDSNNVAVSNLSEMCSGMKDDPAYYEYMCNRETHFEAVNGLIADNRSYVNAIETNQISEAQSAGYISEEEAKTAIQSINDGASQIRVDSINAGELATSECISSSLSYAKTQHSSYESFNGDEEEASQMRDMNDRCIVHLSQGKELSEQKLESLKTEQAEYIASNNYGFYEVANDPVCRDYRSQIESLQNAVDNYQHSETMLESDNAMIGEQFGLEESNEQNISVNDYSSNISENMVETQSNDTENVISDESEDVSISMDSGEDITM